MSTRTETPDYFPECPECPYFKTQLSRASATLEAQNGTGEEEKVIEIECYTVGNETNMDVDVSNGSFFRSFPPIGPIECPGRKKVSQIG